MKYQSLTNEELLNQYERGIHGSWGDGEEIRDIILSRMTKIPKLTVGAVVYAKAIYGVYEVVIKEVTETFVKGLYKMVRSSDGSPYVMTGSIPGTFPYSEYTFTKKLPSR